MTESARYGGRCATTRPVAHLPPFRDRNRKGWAMGKNDGKIQCGICGLWFAPEHIESHYIYAHGM